jgi:hypothetical protein
MPKDNNKGKAATAKAAEDFDDMLAEFRAADLTNPAASPGTSTSTGSSSSSRSSGSTTSSVLPLSGTAVGRNVSEKDIMQAAIRGDVKQMKRWARMGVRVHTAGPLCQAAGSGKLESVCCLVNELGADVNLADKEGCTPLYIAAQESHTAVARCLVKVLGADVEKAAETDCTPFCIAVQEGHLEVTCCLVKELGADVNIENQHGVTPLLVAVEEGSLPMVRRLIENLGADVNKATHNGRTPLMVASHGGYTKIVHLLTKHGADSQVCAPDFGTAADISNEYGAPSEVTEYLEAKMHCSNLGCSGAGIKKCTGCKQARYCGQACQLTHWPVHKVACKAHQAKVGKGQ